MTCLGRAPTAENNDSPRYELGFIAPRTLHPTPVSPTSRMLSPEETPTCDNTSRTPHDRSRKLQIRNEPLCWRSQPPAPLRSHRATRLTNCAQCYCDVREVPAFWPLGTVVWLALLPCPPQPPFRLASPEPSIGKVVDRRGHQNGPDPSGQIPHLPAEVGHRRLRACAALEEQRLDQQEHWQDAHEEQKGFEQGGRLSVGTPDGADDRRASRALT